MGKRSKVIGFAALTRRGRADFFDHLFTAGMTVAMADRMIEGGHYEQATTAMMEALHDLQAARGLICCHDCDEESDHAR